MTESSRFPAALAPPAARIRGFREVSRTTWFHVGALVLLAAAVRVPTLGLQSYEFDEAVTLKVIGGSFGGAMHGVASSESTPPLYYLLAWIWRHVAGLGEFGVRLLPAVAGMLLVPVVYALGRTLASTRVALIGAAIVATSPYLVFYSQEARAYSLFVLFSLLALLYCVRAIQQPTSSNFALWAAVSILAVATHYFALFPLAGQVVALVVYRAPRRKLALTCGVVLVAVIPLLVLARYQEGRNHVGWIGASSLAQRIRVTVETFALGATFRGSLPHTLLVVCAIFAIVIAAGVAVAAIWLARRTDRRERRSAVVLCIVTGVSIAIPLVGALGPADYLIHKNLIPVLPQTILLLALGLGCKRAGRPGVAAATCIVLSGLGLTATSFAAPAMRRADVRQVSNELGVTAHARLIVFVPRWQVILEHYQAGLQPLPPAGRRVGEIDVFTTSTSLPTGTVPRSFRLASVRRGNTFSLYRFTVAKPQLVRPGDLARHTFSESGLQPIALYQR